jgi:chitodextrinase
MSILSKLGLITTNNIHKINGLTLISMSRLNNILFINSPVVADIINFTSFVDTNGVGESNFNIVTDTFLYIKPTPPNTIFGMRLDITFTVNSIPFTLDIYKDGILHSQISGTSNTSVQIINISTITNSGNYQFRVFSSQTLTYTSVFRYSVQDVNFNVIEGWYVNQDTPQNTGGDIIPPTAPTNLTFSNTTSNSILLDWTQATDNVAVTNNLVYQDGVLIITLGNVVTFNVSGLSPGTSYNFKVVARDAAGNLSPDSNIVSPSTSSGSGDTIAPSIPQNVTSFVNNTIPSITVNWDSSSDNVGVAGYELWRDVDGVGLVLYISTAGLSYNDSAVDYGSTYLYRVRAYDAAANFSEFSNSTQKTPFVSCFVKGTLITLSDGASIKIENLVNKQYLLSSNIETLQDTNDVKELYKWTSTFLNETRIESDIVKIEKEYAYETIIINNGLLEATPMHSQLIKRKDVWNFIPIGEVLVGDYLYNINKEEMEITSVEINKEEREIYPITLSDISHTYFANGILTHNVK